ncbi:hypothetical protein T439DRAFT_295137, partial [Meredithblackwellia eburnea MCA 4105]
RLDTQHQLLKQASGGILVHPSITLPSKAAILDSAAGTGTWLFDLSSLTGKRLGRLTAFDISDIQFPPPAQRVGVEFFEHNVTEPLPEEYWDQFDLVHQRLLVFGLTMEEWDRAIVNLAKAVKPGGYLQLVEVEPLITPGVDGKTTNAVRLANKVMQIACEVGGKDWK